MNYYGKQQCMDMDWNNPKDITSEEIAYCIITHDIDTDNIPEARLKTITKEIAKLHNHIVKEKERKLIEAELEIYEHIDDGTLFGKFTDEGIGYYLDPDLFETNWEAVTAMNELSSCFNYEMIKTEEYNHQYKDTNNYTRDIDRLKKSMDKVRKQYIKLGGSETEFNKYVEQIPTPYNGTIKQDIDENRNHIKERFISEGVSPTRANKIAIAITTEVYKTLK